MRQGSAWRKLWLAALLVAISVSAVAALPQPGVEGSTVDRVLVGDLELADDDEGPSDGVAGTFVAEDLAPGDRYRSKLLVLRDASSGLPSRLTPQVTISFDLEDPSAMADALAIEELRYGEEDLRSESRASCGYPLTFAQLAACTQRDEHPLARLADPTPEGRELVMAVSVDHRAANHVQGREVSFDVEVELHGEAVPQESGCLDDAATGQGRGIPRGLLDPYAVPLLDGSALARPALAEVLFAAQLPSDC